MTVAGFQRHWRSRHGGVAGLIPGVRSYVQNHAVLLDGASAFPYPGFDACSELDFDDVAAMEDGFTSPHYLEKVRADEDAFVDKTRFSMVLAEVHVLRDAPAGRHVKLLTFLRAHPAGGRSELVDALAGPYAAALAHSAVERHELLVALDTERTGRERNACDAISVEWFRDVRSAQAHVPAVLGEEAGLMLAGLAFGCERLLAEPIRIV